MRTFIHKRENLWNRGKVNLIWKLTDMSRRELARTMAMERPENMKSEKQNNNSNGKKTKPGKRKSWKYTKQKERGEAGGKKR